MGAKLKPVTGTPTGVEPPRTLGCHGSQLWNSITAEFEFNDTAGKEYLCQACQALDVAEALRERIEADGLLIETQTGPKENPLLKAELGYRSFIVRTLARLGIAFEPVKTPGRPAAGAFMRRDW